PAAPAAPASRPAPRRAADPGIEALRAELRALVAEELAQLIKR
ncbi:aldehyde dehydrogenase, partial [Mycolicibacterium vaccae ATCC 25954]